MGVLENRDHASLKLFENPLVLVQLVAEVSDFKFELLTPDSLLVPLLEKPIWVFPQFLKVGQISIFFRALGLWA